MNNSEPTLPPAFCHAADFDMAFDKAISPVEGWLAREEAELLYRAARHARSGRIVEVGAYRGRSTVALALGSRDGAGLPVFSVDPHAHWTGPGGGQYGPADREAFYRTVLSTDIAPWSHLVGLRSVDAARAVDGPLAVLFIDGDHRYAAVMQDLRAWAPKLAPDGLLLMDDVSDSFDGPRRALQDLLRDGWTMACEPVGKVVALRPPRLSGDPGSIAPASVGGIRLQRAQELVTASRLDLGAKHLYARHERAGRSSAWARRVYLGHLQIWNGFFEHVPRKRSPEDFLSSFDRVLQDTAASPEEGLDTVVPVTLDGSPLNGAHRVAAAVLHGRKVRTMPLEVVPANARYDGNYFDHLVATRGDGGEPRLVLSMALEFIRIAPACQVVVLFPHVRSRRVEVDELLARHGRTVWAFDRQYVDVRSQRALVRLLYEGEQWLGDASNGFAGAASKADPCFQPGVDVRFVLLQPFEGADLTAMKRDVRALFDVGNHCVHVTDTVPECDRILRTTWDTPAFDLYQRTLQQWMPAFAAQFGAFRAAVVAAGREEEVVVTGSAVLALFGLRDSADMDHLHLGPPVVVAQRDDIGSHDAYVATYPAAVAELVLDPAWHLVVDGVRFLRPAGLRAFKAKRGEPKDHDDLVLLAQIDGIAADPPAEWPAGATLWIVDAGDGRAEHISRLLGLRNVDPHALRVVVGWAEATRADEPALLGADAGPELSAPEIAHRLHRRPGTRVLVISDGLPQENGLLGLAALVPKHEALVMRWRDIEGWRETFLQGLASFAGLPADASWVSSAQEHWDLAASKAP
jgi:hypothetical protein